MIDKHEQKYTEWKTSPDVDKFFDFEEYVEGRGYLEKFYKDIEHVLKCVPEGIVMSQPPELDTCEVVFGWYSHNKGLDIRIESEEKKIRFYRDLVTQENFYFDDEFDGLFDGQILLEDTERISKLFKWLTD